MIYFSNDQACVIYLKKRNTAYLAVEGFVNSSSVRVLMMKTFELSLKMKVRSLLVDSSKLEILRDEDVKWILDEIYPKFRLLPLESIAYIKPLNVFGENSVKKLIPKNTLKEFKMFLNIEEAEHWLFRHLNHKVMV